jgi:hypothetical protein
LPFVQKHFLPLLPPFLIHPHRFWHLFCNTCLYKCLEKIIIIWIKLLCIDHSDRSFENLCPFFLSRMWRHFQMLLYHFGPKIGFFSPFLS